MAGDKRTSRKGDHDERKGNGKAKESGERPGLISRPETILGGGKPRPDYTRYRVEPGKRFRLDDLDPDDTAHYDDKEGTLPELEELHEKIDRLQERLFAEQKRSVLILLQAMDTGGKDGAIRGVFSSVNPQGCHVWSFKAPTPDELAHDFLWRIHARTPARGMITIFNRSHYEDVLIVRVHNFVPEEVWSKRYDAINDWERLLHDSGTVILKFYLHISKQEQKERLEARRDDPEKQWKFNPADLGERALWGDYMAAYEEALNRCSTEYAPWYAIPSNKKWYRNLVIARVLADTLEAMDPRFPAPKTDLSKVEVPD